MDENISSIRNWMLIRKMLWLFKVEKKGEKGDEREREREIEQQKYVSKKWSLNLAKENVKIYAARDESN